MRVVGGDWRGRKLEEPRDWDVTRPTADRVREACASMFDANLPHGIEGVSALDAFAGSGAMGVELLSRGARHVLFYDIDRAAASLVRRNVELVGCSRSRYRVTCGDVLLAAERGLMDGAPFDAVFIDPPYALGAEPAEELLGSLLSRDLLAPGAVVLFERSTAATPPLRVEGLTPLREKRYGGTTVDLLVLEGGGGVGAAGRVDASAPGGEVSAEPSSGGVPTGSADGWEAPAPEDGAGA